MPCRATVQQQPGVPPVPAQLAGGVEGALWLTCSQAGGEGEGVQPEVEDALRHSEGGERKDRLRSYTNQCL